MVGGVAGWLRSGSRKRRKTDTANGVEGTTTTKVTNWHGAIGNQPPPLDEQHQDATSRRDSAALTTGAESVIDPLDTTLVGASTEAQGALGSSDEGVNNSDNDSNDSSEAPKLPATTDPTSFRLTTAFAEEDLKRWVVTVNDSLSGPSKHPRTIDFIKDPRFTKEMLINALDLAIIQVCCEVAHVKSLVEYAGREPYRRYLRFDEHEFTPYARADAKNFAGAKRRKVEVLLFETVEVLDYLREKAETFSKKIVAYKQSEAKDGDWAEIADLLRLGAVDEEWVDNHCVGV